MGHSDYIIKSLPLHQNFEAVVRVENINLYSNNIKKCHEISEKPNSKSNITSIHAKKSMLVDLVTS